MVMRRTIKRAIAIYEKTIIASQAKGDTPFALNFGVVIILPAISSQYEEILSLYMQREAPGFIKNTLKRVWVSGFFNVYLH